MATSRRRRILGVRMSPGWPVCLAEPLEERRLLSGLSFAARVNYATGAGDHSVAATDVNGDGKLDLVVANDVSNTVSILLGRGDGTFAAKVDYPTGSGSECVIAADFSGDGKMDLAVTNQYSNNVSVLLGRGDGTFAAKVDYATGLAPWFGTAGDFNGDGKIDLAVENRDSNTVSVLMNSGNGAFVAKADYATGTTPLSVTSADFNGDGKLDLAVGNRDSNTVSLLMNNGNGTFAAKVDSPSGTAPRYVTAADFNGDGKMDLAVCNNDNSNTVSVLMNNGNGTFAAKASYPTGSYPLSLATADFSGDGKLDLAVCNWGSNTVSALSGNGNGTFAAKVDYATGSTHASVTAADFNGDGKVDLAMTSDNNVVGVMLNNSTYTVQKQPTALSGLSVPATVTYGTASVTFAGTVSAAAAVPPGTESVAVMLNGVTVNASIGTSGHFSATFNIATLPASSTPYRVTYSYAGDSAFNSVVDSTTSTLTVTPPGGLPNLVVTDSSASATDKAVALPVTAVGSISAAAVFTLTNAGTQALAISAFPAGSPANFLITVKDNSGNTVSASNFTSIPAGQAYAIQVQFSPVSAGNKSGTIIFNTSDANAALVTLSMSGNALTPGLLTVTDNSGSVNDKSIALADTVVGSTSTAASFTLRNTGQMPLTISNFPSTNPTDFRITVKDNSGNTVSPSSIPAGQAYTIQVQFSPASAGNKSSAITFNTNDANNPSVTLSMSGNAFTLGSIKGTVFNDANGNKTRQTSEAGLAGWTVFVDQNNNGVLDKTEQNVKTDATGNFSLSLAAGSYTLSVVPKTGYKATTPANGKLTVKVSAGQTLIGRLFGFKK